MQGRQGRIICWVSPSQEHDSKKTFSRKNWNANPRKPLTIDNPPKLKTKWCKHLKTDARWKELQILLLQFTTYLLILVSCGLHTVFSSNKKNWVFPPYYVLIVQDQQFFYLTYFSKFLLISTVNLELSSVHIPES